MYVGGLHFYVSPSHLQKCICFFLYPLLRRRCYLSQKLWNFFVNELRRLSVSNLVEVFFIIHIASHIYPISGCLGRNKFPLPSLPPPLQKLAAPLFVHHHSQTWFCRRLTFGQLSESIDKFVSSLNSHRNWVSEERNQLNLRYSCHGRVVSSLYPEFNSLENNDKN